jgi:hypothetical protein
MLALPAPSSPRPGGQGEGAAEARGGALSRSDIRLQAQAIRGRWPIRAEKRQEIIDTLTVLACHPDRFGVRESIAAASCLLTADRINMDDEAQQVKGPEAIEIEPGKVKIDFTKLSDEELERFIANGGKV